MMKNYLYRILPYTINSNTEEINLYTVMSKVHNKLFSDVLENKNAKLFHLEYGCICVAAFILVLIALGAFVIGPICCC